MTRFLTVAAAGLMLALGPQMATASDRPHIDRIEDRLDRRESRIDERFDRNRRDVIEDRIDRRESRRDRADLTTSRVMNRIERRSIRYRLHRP